VDGLCAYKSGLVLCNVISEVAALSKSLDDSLERISYVSDVIALKFDGRSHLSGSSH